MQERTLGKFADIFQGQAADTAEVDGAATDPPSSWVETVRRESEKEQGTDARRLVVQATEEDVALFVARAAERFHYLLRANLPASMQKLTEAQLAADWEDTSPLWRAALEASIRQFAIEVGVAIYSHPEDQEPLA